MTLRIVPVALLVTLTVAPATTDPVLSVTVPVIVPPATCAETRVRKKAVTQSNNIPRQHALIRTGNLRISTKFRLPLKAVQTLSSWSERELEWAPDSVVARPTHSGPMK